MMRLVLEGVSPFVRVDFNHFPFRLNAKGQAVGVKMRNRTGPKSDSNWLQWVFSPRFTGLYLGKKKKSASSDFMSHVTEMYPAKKWEKIY